MNKWFYRAVGVASGALLISGGAAHAEAAHESKVDPQAMRGLFADLFTPTGGQHNLGLSIDNFHQADQPGIFRMYTSATKDTLRTSVMPDLTDALPTTDLLNELNGGRGDRRELLSGPAAGASSDSGGLLGNLTGGLGVVQNLTGGLTNGIGGGGAGAGGGGLLGGLAGGGSPLNLIGGLTGSDGPLSGLTNGLTGSGSPLSGITGALPVGSLGGLFGGNQPNVSDPASDFADTSTSFDPQMMRDFLAAQNASGLATDGPRSTDIIDPALRGSAADTTNQNPVVLDPALASQVNDVTAPMVQQMLNDAMAKRDTAVMQTPIADQTMTDLGVDPRVIGQPEDLPVVGALPLTKDLLGSGGPLSEFIVFGQLFNHLPVVGDVLDGNLSGISHMPIVGTLVNKGLIQGGGQGLPIVGSLPFVGGALDHVTDPLSNVTGSLTGGLTGATNPSGNTSGLGALTGGLGAVGDLTSPLTNATGGLGALTGGLTGTSNPAMDMSPAGVSAQEPGSMFGDAQVTPMVAPAQAVTPGRIGVQQPQLARAKAPARVPSMLQRLTTNAPRPTVADREFGGESGGLPLLGDAGALPVSTLVRQLPIVSTLPVVGSLQVPLGMLKALPVVGALVPLQ